MMLLPVIFEASSYDFSKNMLTMIFIFRSASGKLDTKCHQSFGTNRTSPGFKMTRVATV